MFEKVNGFEFICLNATTGRSSSVSSFVKQSTHVDNLKRSKYKPIDHLGLVVSYRSYCLLPDVGRFNRLRNEFKTTFLNYNFPLRDPSEDRLNKSETCNTKSRHYEFTRDFYLDRARFHSSISF